MISQTLFVIIYLNGYDDNGLRWLWIYFGEVVSDLLLICLLCNMASVAKCLILWRYVLKNIRKSCNKYLNNCIEIYPEKICDGEYLELTQSELDVVEYEYYSDLYVV